MKTLLSLLVLSSLGMASDKSPELSLVATYPVVTAGADGIDADFVFRNESPTATWCLVWYDRNTAYAEQATRTLVYTEDLDRNPELASCGGANAFATPVYKCISPGKESRISTRIWVVPPPSSVAEIVRNLGRPKVRVVVAPGTWTIVARFAYLKEGLVPEDLWGVQLCKFLSASERHIEASQQISIQPDASEAWASRRQALAELTGRQVHDQYLLDRYIEFFESLTGIRSELQTSAGGLVLNRAVLDKALAKYDAWHRENGHAVHWDPTQQRYVTSSER